MRDFRDKEEASPLVQALKSKRTLYVCAAQGCPNTGSIDDRGEHNPGRCFYHWQAAPKDWPEITAKIKANRSMLNFGNVPIKPSRFVQEVRAGLIGKAAGLINAKTGAKL